jgi:hypothetical protein
MLILTNKQEFYKQDINALIEKWIPCDLLWAPMIATNNGSVMNIKDNNKYHPFICLSQERLLLLALPNPYSIKI